jgi:hypothetical protein
MPRLSGVAEAPENNFGAACVEVAAPAQLEIFSWALAGSMTIARTAAKMPLRISVNPPCVRADPASCIAKECECVIPFSLVNPDLGSCNDGDTDSSSHDGSLGP